MDKIIEYGIASANNHLELAGYVNIQIAAGWQPYGNVFHPNNIIKYSCINLWLCMN